MNTSTQDPVFLSDRSRRQKFKRARPFLVSSNEWRGKRTQSMNQYSLSGKLNKNYVCGHRTDELGNKQFMPYISSGKWNKNYIFFRNEFFLGKCWQKKLKALKSILKLLMDVCITLNHFFSLEIWMRQSIYIASHSMRLFNQRNCANIIGYVALITTARQLSQVFVRFSL